MPDFGIVTLLPDVHKHCIEIAWIKICLLDNLGAYKMYSCKKWQKYKGVFFCTKTSKQDGMKGAK